MSGLLHALLVGLLTALLIGGLARLIRGGKPATLDQAVGTIQPERWSAWITIIVGALIFVGGLWFSIQSGGGWGAAAMALIGATIAGFMAPSATSIHAVHWDNEGIEGPSDLFGLTLGLARTKIAWGDIVSTGSTVTSYWYVEATDGRRVYWSFLYKGYGALLAALETRCPSLEIAF